MLEQVASLRDWSLQAPLEVVVPGAVFLLVLAIGLILGLTGRARAGEDDGLEAEARRWIEERIDEHIADLAAAYGEAGARADADDLPPGFAATIESFIAEVLLRQRERAGIDVDLASAVREFVVFHRAQLYEDVLTRARTYLATA